MLRRSGLRLPRGTKLIALAMAAVLLPTAVLFALQYRSLVDLEDKTKVATEENLRRTLEGVARKTKDEFEGLVNRTLAQINPDHVYGENFSELESHFASIKQAHPEIDRLFVIANSSCHGREFALFYDDAGSHRVYDEELKTDTAAQKITNELGRVRALYSASRPGAHHESDTFLGHACSCTFMPTEHEEQLIPYAFHQLHGREKKHHLGLAGFVLRRDYVKDTFLTTALPEVLREAGVIDAELAVAVIDENNKEIFSNAAGHTGYEVKVGFSPVFQRWQLATSLKGKSIAALASENFKRNLAIALLMLSLLVLGIFLAVRSAAREVKLAEAKSAFVSNVSHELKTPLALIRLFAETLELGRVKSPERAREYYRIINSESRRLTQLINNILDFSKMEAGRKQYQFERADLGEVVAEVIKSYEYQITSAGFDLKVGIDRDLPLVSVDRDAISQAVLNLLNNAVKYSGEAKQIDVRVRPLDGNVAIEVADKGVGIPRSEQEKIFEKFYRVSAGLVHDTKGSGLGLAIVKHAVEAHKGQVLVESAPGAGSRFTILLPATPAESAREGMSQEAGGYKIAEGLNN